MRSLRKHPKYNSLYVSDWYEKDNRRLYAAVARSRRFAKMRLNYYTNLTDKEMQMQFSAVTFLLEDGTVYVAFRGTDETIVGWREDFDMALKSPIPSQTAGTPKTKGFPPASMMPSLTASTISLRWMCPGTMSFQEFAIPMNGFSKSSSSRPSARSRLLWGALSRPFLTASLLMMITSVEWFGIMGMYVKFAQRPDAYVDRTARIQRGAVDGCLERKWFGRGRSPPAVDLRRRATTLPGTRNRGPPRRCTPSGSSRHRRLRRSSTSRTRPPDSTRRRRCRPRSCR